MSANTYPGMQPLVMPALDERDREEQRYAVYAVSGWVEGKLQDAAHHRREIASTPTLEGVGPMLAHLRDEGQITDDHRIGLLDRVTRTWIVNPWAKGQL